MASGTMIRSWYFHEWKLFDVGLQVARIQLDEDEPGPLVAALSLYIFILHSMIVGNESYMDKGHTRKFGKAEIKENDGLSIFFSPKRNKLHL